MTTAPATRTATNAPETYTVFRTTRATLVRALTTVGVALARKPVVPSLGGVLLNGQNGRLNVTTTDLDTVATARVPDTEATPGRFGY